MTGLFTIRWEIVRSVRSCFFFIFMTQCWKTAFSFIYFFFLRGSKSCVGSWIIVIARRLISTDETAVLESKQASVS